MGKEGVGEGSHLHSLVCLKSKRLRNTFYLLFIWTLSNVVIQIVYSLYNSSNTGKKPVQFTLECVLKSASKASVFLTRYLMIFFSLRKRFVYVQP